MASRIVARKPARFIPIDSYFGTNFNPRAEIPISNANVAQSRCGHYKAELIGIDPIYNCAHAVGGPPDKEMYAWIYRTMNSRGNIFLEDSIDDDGEPFEFVFYTNTVLGDPISSLTAHVRDLIGENPDPEVWERVGLSKLVGSSAIIRIESGKYVVPSRSVSRNLFKFEGQDWYRWGQHMTRIARNLLIPPPPKKALLQAIADVRNALAEEAKPAKKPLVGYLDLAQEPIEIPSEESSDCCRPGHRQRRKAVE